jgi:hypothetical protein
VAEGARLESVYTATYRGFESLPHRQMISPSNLIAWAFSLCAIFDMPSTMPSDVGWYGTISYPVGHKSSHAGLTSISNLISSGTSTPPHVARPTLPSLVSISRPTSTQHRYLTLPVPIACLSKGTKLQGKAVGSMRDLYETASTADGILCYLIDC